MYSPNGELIGPIFVIENVLHPPVKAGIKTVSPGFKATPKVEFVSEIFVFVVG